METSRTEATATSPGVIVYTCSNCNTAKTEEIPALEPTTPGEAVTMTGLLAALTDVFSAALGWVGVVSQTIAATPMLLLCVVAGFIGAGVILFKRLLN